MRCDRCLRDVQSENHVCWAADPRPRPHDDCGCQSAALRAELERTRAEVAEQVALGLKWRECAQALAEALESRGEHEWSCARADFRGGRPRDDGGYEFNYHGVWYESRPEDHTPKCDCEIGPALARFDAMEPLRGDAPKGLDKEAGK